MKNKKGFFTEVLGLLFIFIILLAIITPLIYFFSHVPHNKIQANKCNELKNLGFQTYLEHNSFFKLTPGRSGDICYVYLEDGRRVVYTDIENNINVNLAKTK